ncbi:hypothetical protein [Candidatus Nitrosocosmicus sp. T]
MNRNREREILKNIKWKIALDFIATGEVKMTLNQLLKQGRK